MSRHTVCAVEELPAGAHIILAVKGRVSIGVYNIHGTLVAVRNSCPHAGAPLCRGALTGAAVSDGPRCRRWAHEGEILKCPWHGWEFKLPEGVTLSEPPIRVKTYPVLVEDGRIIVELGGARDAGADTDAEATVGAP